MRAITADGEGADLRTLVRLGSEDRLHPEVGLSLPRERAGEAIMALRRRLVRGNAVVQVTAPDSGGDRRPGRNAVRGTREVMACYLDALVAGDLEAIADSFADQATWWLHGNHPLSGTKNGRTEIVDFLAGAGSLFLPGSQAFRFGETTVEGERAVPEWQVTGTGAATGQRYDNSYCGVFVVRDGVIVEVREYLDSQHAAQVLFDDEPAVVQMEPPPGATN